MAHLFFRKLPLLVFFLGLLLAPLARAERPAAATAEIEYLLQRVASSDAKFIRDGTQYSPQDAVALMRKKLSWAGDRVKTADDFVSGIATKSSTNGKPYFIVLNGKQVPSGEWLTKLLAEHRAKGAKKAE